MADLRFRPPDLRPVDLHELSGTLFYTACYAGLAAEVTGTNDPVLAGQLTTLNHSITDLRKGMLDADLPHQAEYSHKLAVFQQALFFDLLDTFQLLQHQDDTTVPTVADLPPAIKAPVHRR